MSRILRFLKKQPAYFWIYAAVTTVVHLAAYWLPDLFKLAQPRMLGSAFDDSIPVVPGFIYIYVGAFFFWIGGFAYYYAKGKALAKRVFTADLICKIVGFTAYCLYPCTLKQPSMEGITGFGAGLMKLIYLSDQPAKLLPSMHCYASILLALPVFYKGAQPVSTGIKIFFPLMAIAVCASTLFVKQHVFADVYTAAALAAAAWGISLGLWRLIDAKKLRAL